MIEGELSIRVDAVLAGPVAPFGPGGIRSGIAKSPVPGVVRIGFDGLDGDEQADTRHHGGPEKAVHHYAWEHYEFWRSVLPVQAGPALAAHGAFGENLSTLGVTEDGMCVGDLWRLGSALLQVSQARQPCFKLNHRFGVPDMARRVQASCRTGWYYRVVEPGSASAGDELRHVERPHPEWALARVLRAFYVDRLDREALAGLAALEVLSESWRTLAARRLARGVVEDWSPRLDGARPIVN